MRKVPGEKFLCVRGTRYYFRRRVPKGLEWAFGGRDQIPVALFTSDLRTARRRLAKELEKFEQTIDEALQEEPFAGLQAAKTVTVSSRPSSQSEIEQAVRRWLAERMERASNAAFHFSPRQGDDETLKAHEQSVQTGLAMTALEPSQTTQWVAEAIAEQEGWVVDRRTGWWRALLLLCGRGQIEADKWLLQDLNGHPREVSDARFHPEQYRLDTEREAERAASAPVSITDLLALCLAEKEVAPATTKVWKRHVVHFVDFLGHDDATKVELSHIVAWKERLLGEPGKLGRLLSRRTVRDSYLACIKALFAWATENGKINGNPALGVRVAGKGKGKRVRDRGLTDAEADLILAATLQPEKGRLSPERALARRWVPWLCAYTGARVNEITQLRAEDVSEHNGLWTIHITPEAGSTKNGLPRTVAIHSHLVDQGFLALVQGKKGPMFYDPALRRDGSDAHPQYKKVGEFLAHWVRTKVGVDDPNIWPNHGWRHRFKTQARDVRMDAEIRDYIQGHAPRTEGEGYGYVSPQVTQREIEKLPRYDVKTSGQ